MQGIAFETRMSTYNKANRTLTSYAKGKVKDRDHAN
jgi:hypothetical protein